MHQKFLPSLFCSKLYSPALLIVLYALPVLTIKLTLLISNETAEKTGFLLNIALRVFLRVLTSGLI